jgi:hypothetical protein
MHRCLRFFNILNHSRKAVLVMLPNALANLFWSPQQTKKGGLSALI